MCFYDVPKKIGYGMRILLLCAADINGCINLNRLLTALSGKHNLSVMLSSLELPCERGNAFADKKIWCERDFLLNELFPQLDALPESDAELLTFAGLSKRWNVPIQRIDATRAMACLHEHADVFKPDLVFCCRFDYIIRKELFARPGLLGAFNLHSGLLPKCAGPDATFWAMYNKWSFSGCTIHNITEEIDGGDIIAEAKFELDYRYSVLWNRMHAYEHGLDAFETLVERLEQGLPLHSHAQDKTQRHYYPFPSLTDFSAFRNQGGRLIGIPQYVHLLQRFLPSGMALPKQAGCGLASSKTKRFQNSYIVL
jgi:folate-dependent phosphoribosylglycinamide formyltransferase PurN